MTRAEQLNIAQNGKKDEFYTLLTDIEQELVYYKNSFQGKVVYCNCDDYRESNFVLFFKRHFHEYGLKRLIATCYKARRRNLFDNTDDEPALFFNYDGNGEGSVTMLKGNGDFRSRECIELLSQCDVVVTNPPFSLFREFVATLEAHHKAFLIIGNVNAVSYKECFQMIKEDRMWLGRSIHSGDREFRVPAEYPLQAAGVRIDAEGNKYIKVKGVRWFTNIEYENRFQKLPLYCSYSPDLYPKYDNFDAINVGRTKDIPTDYDDIMGVPITFLDKYNPQQFAIIGNEYSLKIPGGRCYLNGERMYSRIFIKYIGERNRLFRQTTMFPKNEQFSANV